MAYSGSPKDLFASEDSDSDATVDLSVQSDSHTRLPATADALLTSSSKSAPKPNGSMQYSQHTISSSDSEDECHRDTSVPPNSNQETSLLGRKSDDSLVSNSPAGTVSDRQDSVGPKRVASSQQLVTVLSDDRPLCKYGEKCYRKNPSHFQEFSHPGDQHVKMTAPETSGCSPSKRPRTEVSSTSNYQGSSMNAATRNVSTSSFTHSLSPAAIVSMAQPFSFFLTKVQGIESKFNQSLALDIKDLLSLGNLVRSAQFNYCIDIEWLVSQYPAPFRSLPLLIVHGDKNEDRSELELEAMRHANVTLCQARLDMPYGTHHTKMMLLLYDNGLRVIIHTANLVDGDWAKKTQGIWVSPLFPPLDGSGGDSVGESVTRFKRDLLEYLSVYRHRHVTEWMEIIRRHDLSTAKVCLVASVPGRHLGDRKKLFGHLKLRQVLSQFGPDTDVVGSWPVIGQFSSIGSLGTSADSWLCAEWLESVSTVRSGKAAFAARTKPRLQLIFPSVDNVRSSLEGYIAGGSLPYSTSTARKQPWLNAFLHQWKSDRCGRSWASPHIKTYTRASPNSEQLAWFLVTSANLSKAAWGCLEKNSSQLMIRSYELGVLFLPQHFGCKDGYFTTNPQQSTENSLSFTVPFDVPVTPYTVQDRPWVVDLPYGEVDSHGCQWSPS